eukprot:scaffold367461_cov46-Prasinocladus_malaysianus.AAC.1
MTEWRKEWMCGGVGRNRAWGVGTPGVDLVLAGAYGRAASSRPLRKLGAHRRLQLGQVPRGAHATAAATVRRGPSAVGESPW